MDKIDKGNVVLSVAGHDKGRHFLVLESNGDLLTLVDGEIRRVEKPKIKKVKHVKLVYTNEGTRIYDKVRNGRRLENAEIRKAIKSLTTEEVK